MDCSLWHVMYLKCCDAITRGSNIFNPSPFFGEEFGFQVPRDFQQLSFYVMVADTLPLSRDLKLGKVAIDKSVLVKVRGSGTAAEEVQNLLCHCV